MRGIVTVQKGERQCVQRDDRRRSSDLFGRWIQS